jgi:hypothetical protein
MAAVSGFGGQRETITGPRREDLRAGEASRQAHGFNQGVNFVQANPK